MSESIPHQSPPQRVEIRFDGVDAENHQLDIIQLSHSMRGFGRILATCGHFAVTQQHAHRMDAMAVRVLVEEPEAGCFSMMAVITFIETHPLLQTTITAAVPILLTWVLANASGKKEEMRNLRALAEEAIRVAGNRDEKIVDRMMSTMDKMVEALRPAAKQAVAPVGKSAKEVTVGSGSYKAVIGQAEAETIRSSVALELGASDNYDIVITSLDNTTGACKVELLDDRSARINGQITDPEVQLPNSSYALAFAAQAAIRVRAKPSLREGHLERLFISEVLEPFEG